MADEVRHATLSFALASAYAGHPVGPGRLPVGDATLGASLAEIAAATVREGCVNETFASLVAREAADLATEPAVRAALDGIAADEARHAELAWRFVAWALSEGGDDVHAAVARAFDEACAVPSVVGDASDPTLAAHGQLSESEKAVIFEKTALEVIAPTARALLARPREVARQGVAIGA